MRNRLVAALATEIFVAHAAPGSGTKALCREIAGWGWPLLTLAGLENAALLGLGAQPVALPAAGWRAGFRAVGRDGLSHWLPAGVPWARTAPQAWSR